MEKQMTAERSRRAVVTTAEGEKASAILRAEGLKQSAIVNAEGEKQSAILHSEGQAQARLAVAQAEAQALQVIAKGLGEEGNPARYLIAKSYLEALTAIGANAQKTVFLPYEASAAMSAIGAIKELWNAPGTAEGGAKSPPKLGNPS
jgi:regulator of protease activity HflC (stomatin/prohibitin superfamily)